MPTMPERLLDRYDAVLSDLDGVVYAGRHAIPGAPEVLRRISSERRTWRLVPDAAARPVTASTMSVRATTRKCDVNLGPSCRRGRVR